MKVLILNQSEVRELLPMDECMDVMAHTLETLAEGNAILPLRHVMWLPEKVGALGTMPSYLGDIGMMGLKVISVFPGNHGTEYDSHIGAVMLFETKHGQLLAIVDASEITAIRTAAVSGVATRVLAREDASDLTIMGSGIQAQSHLSAMLVARNIKRVRIWSRDVDHAKAFAKRESRRHDIEIEAIADAQRSVEDADIICTTTSAPKPILHGAWLRAGAHINAVGSSVPFTRELDTDAMVKSTLFVDRRESTLNEAGDFLIPKKEGAIDDDHIKGEIGEVLLGKVSGRHSTDEITLFKSLGLAVEDVASAHHAYTKALQRNVGLAVELGGTRDDD
jgi:ornithine cyclodeaminase/alanine dehydrogenase-like protein (mu-crystallin family)